MLRSLRRNNVLLGQASHVTIVNVRGSALRVAKRQQQQKSLLFRHASRRDRVLTTSLGLVSGGILVTSMCKPQKEEGQWNGVMTNWYGDGPDLVALTKGCHVTAPVRNSSEIKYPRAEITCAC